MMPPLTRVGVDFSTGHSSFPPNAISSGSTNVFTNSISTVRQGDPMIPHGSPSPSPPHGGSIATGSGTVMINSKPACRIGDAISCGQAVAQGSGNVICG